MRKSRPRFFLAQKRDKEVFKYLFVTKGATLKQIHRELFQGVNLQVAYRRLHKMMKYGLVGRKAVIFESISMVYYLKSKVFDLGLLDKPSGDLFLVSDKLRHDLVLNEIRSCFKNLRGFHSYYTENEIQSGFDLKDRYPVKNLKLIHSDGFLAADYKGSEYHFAVEYERSAKSKKRYMDVFSAYYASKDIDNVIYFTESSYIKNLIFRSDLEFLKSRNLSETKIFVVNLQEYQDEFTSLKLLSSQNHSVDFNFSEPVKLEYRGT